MHICSLLLYLHVLCMHVYTLHTYVNKHVNISVYDMHCIVCNRQIYFLNVKHCLHPALVWIWLLQ